tara:strand:+ start:236 stop:523 length:288 start_codon:yes stop_codon:yes gene_type:complete
MVQLELFPKTTTICLSSFEITLPTEALKQCYHSGQCDDDVDFWYKKIDWSSVGLTDKQIISEVQNYAMEDNKTIEDYRKSILWLASADYQEKGGQ